MPYERVRRIIDYPFRVRSNIAGAGVVLDRLLASFPESRDAAGLPTYTLWEQRESGKRFTLTLDGGKINRVNEAGSLVDWLLIDITRKAMAGANGYVAVHAGVVSRGGAAVLMPAASSSGKTTTVAGLVRAGASYLSDEVALLRLTDARVHPFPRPLVMDESSLEALDGLLQELPSDYEAFRGRWYHVGPDDLRPGATGEISVPACVVSPRYIRGSATRLLPITRAETLFLLGKNAFNLTQTGAEGLALLRTLALRVPGFRLEFGDLNDAVSVVTDLLERSAVTASALGA